MGPGVASAVETARKPGAGVLACPPPLSAWGFSAAHCCVTGERSAPPASGRGGAWPHRGPAEPPRPPWRGDGGSRGPQPLHPPGPLACPRPSRVGPQHRGLGPCRGPWDTSLPLETPFGAGYLMTGPALMNRGAGLCLPGGGQVDFPRRWLVIGGTVGVLRV